jgi:hypothetical protein
VNVVVVGTLAIVNVPLYPATPTFATVTLWPVRKPCGLVVVMVAVDPDSVAPVGDAAMVLTNSNALLMPGGATTVILALAVFPMPPSFELTLPVTLFWMPAVVPVTVTLNEHVPLAAMLPPERVRTLEV